MAMVVLVLPEVWWEIILESLVLIHMQQVTLLQLEEMVAPEEMLVLVDRVVLLLWELLELRVETVELVVAHTPAELLDQTQLLVPHLKQ